MWIEFVPVGTRYHVEDTPWVFREKTIPARSKNWFKPGKQLSFAITFTCLTAFVLFGYDQGVLGGLLGNTDFIDILGNPAPGKLGIIVSVYNIGCFVGCALNFWFGARFGRRDAIWVAMICVAVGGVLQCAAYGVPQFMVGRFITGLGVGIDTSTVPMYQAELCKAEVRGRLVTSEVFFVALGVSVAYFLDYGFSFIDGPVAWRVSIALQVPLAMFVAVLVIGLPETPRWLCAQGRVDEASAVIRNVNGLAEDDNYVVTERAEILKAIEIETTSAFKWSRLFSKDPLQTGYRIFLACLVLFMNQWCGINVIVFYVSVVLTDFVGLDRNTAVIAGGCINLAFAAGSLVPAFGADRLGRRKPMLFGAIGMGISMMCVAILLSFKGKPQERITANASIAFLVTYMISFGASLNAIPWLYSTEILPLRVRAQGTALAVFNNWIWVFLIVMVTPTLFANCGWKTYLIFMVFNFAFVPMIYFLFPETKGLTLEKIDFLFLKEDELVQGHSTSVHANVRDEKQSKSQIDHHSDAES